MKIIFLLLSGIIALSFASSSFENQFVQPGIVYYNDSIQETEPTILQKMAQNFNPKQLNLNNSLLENVELNSYLTKTDKEVIRSSEDYDYFITMIVLKQYELHITKFHQAFDLFSMKAGNAGFVVQSFVELSHQPEGTKGLKSSEVLTYIASNEKLKNDSSINEIVERINALPK